MFIEFFGAAGEDRANAEIVGSFNHGCLCLFERMRRTTNQFVGADDASCVGDGDVVLPEMDAVRVTMNGNIRTVVDDEEHVDFSCFLTSPLCQVEERFRVERFFAELNDIDAVDERLFDHLFQ